MIRTQRLEEIILEEVALRVRGVHRPEVVRDDVEDAEDKDEEGGGPLGLEADGNHDARDEADDRDEHAPDAPFSLDDEAQEEEDQENAACEEEAAIESS